MKKLAIVVLAILAMGLLSAGAALAAKELVIGVPTSMGFLEGKESVNAVNLAVEEINAAGGVKVGGEGLPIKVVTIDIRDAAPGVPVPEALLGLEKLIMEQKPNALVVGPFRSEALMAGMDLIARHKVPLLGTIAMTPKTEEKIAGDPKYKYIFRTCLNAKYFVGYLVGTMAFLNQEFGFKKVFIMNQDVAWARITAKIVSGVLADKMKMEVLGVESFPTGADNFSPALLKAKMKGADIILPIFDMPQSGTLVKQWKSMKVPAIMAGFVSPAVGPAAWKAFDQKIGGMINCVFEIGSLPAQKYPPAAKFYEAYQKKFGQPIEAGHGPSPSYASVYLFKAAVEKANSLDPDAIAEALAQSDVEAAIGRVKFTPGHQAVYGNDPQKEALGAVFQWTEDGKRVIVYPPAVAEGKIQLPSWMKSKK
ncbi:amino acid ABC transporter substrate-binding protein [Desulfocarbo indianensis]|nr:amino acid ABC transporter substrate-binding protein [Desulfocarbo indianensis]